MHYRYPDHYVVGREKIREYAIAVKNEDPAFFDFSLGEDPYVGGCGGPDLRTSRARGSPRLMAIGASAVTEIVSRTRSFGE